MTQSQRKQYQIEQAAGIVDEQTGKHISSRSTANARCAYDLLCLQMHFYEPAGMALLRASVANCRRDMSGGDPSEGTGDTL